MTIQQLKMLLNHLKSPSFNSMCALPMFHNINRNFSYIYNFFIVEFLDILFPLAELALLTCNSSKKTVQLKINTTSESSLKTTNNLISSY
jgi:hypothetical protein